ncbi:MAG TPA: hypothetical protein VIJ61_11155 [Thermoanaerobaculia bacterium]
MPPLPYATYSVFLNVPFDRRYRSSFIALLAGLTALGCEPHCVLEVPSGGQDRLDRIYGLIESCAASVHDLSRVTLSGPFRAPRFNMPFELGLAYAVSRRRVHRFFLFEERSYRLQTSLSDLNGHDPYIHEGTQEGVLRCVLDCFGTNVNRRAAFALLKAVTRKLGRAVSTLEREHGVEHPFHPYIFRQSVEAAVELARAEGLIA